MSKKKQNNSLRANSPPPHNQKQKSTHITQVTHQQFFGPIPRPDILNGYNQIIPGAAERILKMAEDDAIHQREIEKDALKSASKEVKRGQIYGLIIGILAFVTAIIALFLGSEKTAITICSTTIIGLVTVFVTGRVIQPK